MAATYADSAPRPGVGILYSRSDVGRPAGASARRSCDNVTSRVFSRSLWSGASPWRDWKRRDRRVITDAAAHRGHTDGSRRMGGKCAMPADRYLMARLPAPGARRRGSGTARLWRRAQGSNARGSGRSIGRRTVPSSCRVGHGFVSSRSGSGPFAFPDRAVHGKCDLARRDRGRVYDGRV